MSDLNNPKYKKYAKFNSTLVENMEILSSMDNYYKWISGRMKKYAGNRILDIGCGNGNLTTFFLDRPFVMGLDYSEDYIEKFNYRFKNYSNVHSKIVDMFDFESVIELKKYKIDTLISMNTFEHIKDDQQAFDNTYEILENGGRFILVVPAMKFLYSVLDYAGGHYRRYTKADINLKLTKSGYEINKLFYMNLPGAIGWYLFHVLTKKQIYSPESFNLYNLLVPLFMYIEDRFKPPFGLSVFCVAEKVPKKPTP
jgi:SAM-dependent methyltransferase